MKNIMSTLFNKWSSLLIIVVLMFLLGIFSLWTYSPLLESIAFFIVIFCEILIVISCIYCLVLKQWKNAIIRIIVTLLTTLLLLFYFFLMFWAIQSKPDKFADDLVIPDNININTPLDTYLLRGSLMKSKTDFEIYSSFQPGTYEYDFWIGEIEKGIVYLKAFEVTREYQLSKERLMEKSSVAVHNPTDSIIKFGITNHFTIYEGDWGKPYAARFELWFKPENGEKERKLLEKNYKIEGWQR